MRTQLIRYEHNFCDMDTDFYTILYESDLTSLVL